MNKREIYPDRGNFYPGNPVNKKELTEMHVHSLQR